MLEAENGLIKHIGIVDIVKSGMAGGVVSAGYPFLGYWAAKADRANSTMVDAFMNKGEAVPQGT